MRYLFKFVDALKIIRKAKRSLFFVFRRGASIASTQILHSVQQHVGLIKTIIDVGANQGQFATTSFHFFPNANVYSFEPVPKTFIVLQKNTSRYKNITPYNFALGSSNGAIQFYSNEYSHASSALPVSDLQKSVLPKTATQNLIEVSVKRLDDVIEGINMESPTLLKLDVQGFEKEVLKGALESLKRIDYLLFETSFATMYDGEPLFDEMHSYVKELGFELVAPVGIFQSENLQILQMDVLYKRIK